MTKISVIGAGNLGAAIANDIALRDIVQEIVLVDIKKEMAEGQAADIRQALPFKNRTNVYYGDYADITNSAVIIITAGKPRTAEMSDRLQLAEINLKIVGSIVEQIKKYSPKSIIITITNPMDIINHYIYRQGFPREKVIGSGGQLDSSRLRVTLGFPEKDVEAYVLGEHGQNQVALMSQVKIDGKKVDFTPREKEEVRLKSRESALDVIKKKGSTIFAPAANTGDMVEAIIKDRKRLMACSVNLEGEYCLEDVSLGVLIILGRKGIEIIEEWELSEHENELLQDAAGKLKEFYTSLVK